MIISTDIEAYNWACNQGFMLDRKNVDIKVDAIGNTFVNTSIEIIEKNAVGKVFDVLIEGKIALHIEQPIEEEKPKQKSKTKEENL
jgi:hypothetical protein